MFDAQPAEIVTKTEYCPGCRAPLPTGVVGFPAPGSLTEAQIELADAADALDALQSETYDPPLDSLVAPAIWKAEERYDRALAVLRERRDEASRRAKTTHPEGVDDGR